MAEVQEITSKEEWEDFLIYSKPHTFLQSWNWGEFQKALGHKIWRLGVYANGMFLGAALVIKISAKRGIFLFCPHGPISQVQHSSEVLKSLTDYLKNLAEKESCSFIRISPALLKNSENEKLFKDLSFRQAPIHMHAELVWMLDITLSEDELLKNMRKTTRYMVRKAQNEGVRVIKGRSAKDVGASTMLSINPERSRRIEIFNKLYEETAERQKFSAYSKDYLQKEFAAFSGDDEILLFLAEFKGKIISGAMIIFYGESAFYHQGASSAEYSNMGASYLLQWEAIKEAKNRGLKFYNFWGIAPDSTGKKHPWAGLTLFKKGFGGFSEEYLPAQDLILRPSYWLNFLIEKARKTARGLS